MRKKLFALTCAVGSVALTFIAEASAQTAAAPVTSWHRTVSTWTIEAVTDTPGARVQAFFGWNASGASTGNNFPFILYVRQPGSSGWTFWGWPAGTTKASALAYLHYTFGDGFLPLGNDLYSEFGSSSEAVAPTQLTNGLGADDPLQVFVAVAENPGEVVEVVAALGEGAAPLLSALNADAASETAAAASGEIAAVPALSEGLMLADMVYQSEDAMFGQSTISDPLTDAQRAGLCWGCSTTTGAWGPWAVSSAPDPTNSNFQICTYTRTRTITRTGKEFWGCAVCTSTVETSPAIKERQNAGGDCRTNPLSGS